MVIIIREERHKAIIEELNQLGVVSINMLVKKLNTSRSTIRRDLSDLEEQNLLRCVRGGAELAKRKTSLEAPFDVRKDQFIEEKQRIARAALGLIQENETIILDCGTTVYELAKIIDGSKRLYIATNDLKSAVQLSSVPNIDLMVLGGTLRQRHYSLNGIFTENELMQIHADTVFIGVDAVDLNIGLMNFSEDEVKTKRLMMAASNSVIVLCDHSKFETIAFMNICPLNRIDKIITGREVDPHTLKKLESLKIKVMVV